ncbi:hypothetical protein DKL61_02300 [Gammaproteobacteria bacterium ESL0073]|nr:hypothetical protein DKL61_02300 [Gammaproteobacteria bacterium ESL0073]
MTKYFKSEFAVNGDKVDIPNEIQSSGEVSYQTGFGIDYQRKLGADILAKPFPRQGFNGLVSDITGAIQQYQQNGFFEFITPEMNGGESFDYTMGATVRYDMSETKDGSDVRIFTSLINNNKGNPKDNAKDWREQGKQQGSGYGFIFTHVLSSTTLTEDQAGVVLIDASAGNIEVNLPNTTLNISFIFRRIDNTENTVKIKTLGTDKVKYNQAINANGYSFFSLFGAGDYWRIISDGIGNWFDIERADKAPIGGTNFLSSIIAPIGGYIIANGSILNRTEYPYLWDYAQKSGLLVEDSDFSGNDGCFSKGDGVTTFRIPDLRGIFMRSFDDGRGVDNRRIVGSCQKGSISVIDTGTGGSWSPATALTTDTMIQAQAKAGLDDYNIVDFPDIKMAGVGAVDLIKLPGVGGAYFYTGVMRPKNIAYPVYLKII